MVATFRNTIIDEKLSWYARLRPKSINKGSEQVFPICTIDICMSKTLFQLRCFSIFFEGLSALIIIHNMRLTGFFNKRLSRILFSVISYRSKPTCI